MGMSEGKERGKGTEEIVEVIMAKDFLKSIPAIGLGLRKHKLE